MPRYAQLVMGPAGSGKSTYCSTIVKYGESTRRSIHVINLDPAAEYFDYPILADIRDLIGLDDAMDDDALKFGPNGGLVFCMEYLMQNLDWLTEELGDIEEDYILFDCPGQIELYTHIPVMTKLVEHLQAMDFRICGVFVMDAQFMIEPSKFVSGVMTALSTMVNLEVAHISVMTKLDLLNKSGKKDLDRYLEPDLKSLLSAELETSHFGKKFKKLSFSIARMIDDYSLVKFMPLDVTDEETISDLMVTIDNAIQFGEDAEVKEMKEFEDDPQDNDIVYEDEDYNDGDNNG